MNLQFNSIDTLDRAINECVDGITPENKDKRIAELRDRFITIADDLVRDLQNPVEIEHLRLVEGNINHIETSQKMHPEIEKIQRIALALSTFKQQHPEINMDVDHLDMQDIETIRTIEDPELKGFLLAKCYQYNDINLNSFLGPLNENERMLMAPFLKTIQIIGNSPENLIQPIQFQNFLNACSNLKELTLIHNNEIQTIPSLKFLKKLTCIECLSLNRFLELPDLRVLAFRDCPSLDFHSIPIAFRPLEEPNPFAEEPLPLFFRDLANPAPPVFNREDSDQFAGQPFFGGLNEIDIGNLAAPPELNREVLFPI